MEETFSVSRSDLRDAVALGAAALSLLRGTLNPLQVVLELHTRGITSAGGGETLERLMDLLPDDFRSREAAEQIMAELQQRQAAETPLANVMASNPD